MREANCFVQNYTMSVCIQQSFGIISSYLLIVSKITCSRYSHGGKAALPPLGLVAGSFTTAASSEARTFGLRCSATNTQHNVPAKLS